MNGFDKTRRLLKKSEFDYVFAEAKKIVNSEFIILYRDNMTGFARLGFALSKKNIAKAHDRNRVKRILREAFRTNTRLPSVDLVVLAKPGVDKLPGSEINAKLDKVWNKLANLCEK